MKEEKWSVSSQPVIIISGCDAKTDEEWQKKCKLISAAPEMLERIDAVLTSMRASKIFFESGVQKEKYDYWFNQLELAIKATE